MTHASAVLAAALTVALAGPAATAHADTGWTERPAPFALGTSGLTDVTAAAPDAIWIGGYQWRYSYQPPLCLPVGPMCSPRVYQNPLLQSGGGSSWSWIGTPGMTGSGQITDVDAVSAADVWSVGRRDRSDGHGCGTPYAARDDGGAWTEIPPPSGLLCIEALDADAAGAWVAGRTLDGRNGAGVYRMANGSWTPHDAGAADLVDIRQRAPDDVWAVGRKTPYDHVAHAARFDGSAWHDMTPPQLRGEDAGLTSVLPRAADDVWVTGHIRTTTGGPHEGRSYHWDGASWEEVPSPADIRFGEALVEDATGGLWATTSRAGVLMHFSGGAWTPVTIAPGGGAVLSGLARVPGTGTLLAVGARDGEPIVLARD